MGVVQVDQNVSRHVDSELAATDWDVLILHYLGLDHIGHLAGPRSPLVPLKLTEMDNVVRHIFTSLEEKVGGFLTPYAQADLYHLYLLNYLNNCREILRRKDEFSGLFQKPRLSFKIDLTLM